MPPNEEPRAKNAFPPLPPVKSPGPSRGTDPRQAHALELAPGLAARLPSALDTGTGFVASCVDLGELKDMVEQGTKRLMPSQLAERFYVDVQAFVRSIVTTWVQRPIEIACELTERGLRVRFRTQDDHGVYDYAFEAYPRTPSLHEEH